MTEIYYIPTEAELEASIEEAMDASAIEEIEYEIEGRMQKFDMYLCHFAYDLADNEARHIETLQRRLADIKGAGA